MKRHAPYLFMAMGETLRYGIKAVSANLFPWPLLKYIHA